MKKKILLLSAFAVINHSLYAQVVYGTEENMYVKSMYDNPISHFDNPEKPVLMVRTLSIISLLVSIYTEK